MNRLILIAVLGLFGSCALMAQSKDKEMMALTNDICTCFAKHNPVKDKEFDKTIDKVYRMSNQEAEDYIQQLPEDKRMRFAQNMSKIENLDKENDSFKNCLKPWEERAEAWLEARENAGISEKTLLADMAKLFQKKKKCRVLGLLLLN